MRPQGQGVATALPLFMIRSDPVPHRGHEKSEQVQDHSRSRTGRVVIVAGKGAQAAQWRRGYARATRDHEPGPTGRRGAVGYRPACRGGAGGQAGPAGSALMGVPLGAPWSLERLPRIRIAVIKVISMPPPNNSKRS